jgi:signal transduction histidine kinase
VEVMNEPCISKNKIDKTKLKEIRFKDIFPEKIYKIKIKPYLQKALQGNEVHFQDKFSILTAEEKYYDMAFYPYKRSDKVEKIVVLARDISQYKKVEEKLARSEKLAALGKMAAELAHEIKNPITIIKSTSQLLKKRYQTYDEAKIKKMLDIFVETSLRINDIVEQLRDFTKTEDLEMKRFNLVKLVNDVILFTQERCLSKNITVDFSYYNEKIYILGDESQINKVLLNLMLNSINAIEKQGKIHIKLKKDASKIILQIIDNGKGIPKDLLNKIFDPFFTTNEKGMGLGLGIVYRIINKHNAEIDVKSKVGQGTVFTIIFREDR